MEVFITSHYYKYDLPDDLILSGDVAIDTEAMGLKNHRDRLCAVQISNGDGNAYVIHFPKPKYNCSRLTKLLSDESRTKIFHFGRFDIAILQHYLKIKIKNVYCTKIASKLCRTYTDHHGLKDLCHELLDVKINKQQQSSYWGARSLSREQVSYAGSDVLYLHKLRLCLNEMLAREGRLDLAKQCFDFLPTRAELDLLGWNEVDIFEH